MSEWINVSDVTPRIAYTATASQTLFTVPFVFFSDSDLRVYQNGTLKTLATHYTVSGAEDEDGGSITLLSGATVGDEIMIVRRVAIEQTTHIPPSGPLDVPAINIQISKLIAIDQQNADDIERSLHFPDSDSTTSGELAAPATRANKLLGFDGDGNPIYVNGPTFIDETVTGVAHIDTRSTAAVTTFAASINVVITGGLTAAGDGGGETYVRGTGTGSFTDGGAVSWVPVSDKNVGAVVVSTRTAAAALAFPSHVLFLIVGGTSTVGDVGTTTYKRGAGTGSFTDAGGTSWVPITEATAAFDTKAAAQAATIRSTVPMISLAGYATRGDAPIAWYVRTASEPSHAGKLQSADGAWWVITGPFIFPEQFGCKGDAVTDDLANLQAAETCRQALDCELRFMAKNYYLNNPNSWEVSRPRWQGADHNSTLLSMDGSSTNCIFLKGTAGNTSGYMRDLVLWAPVGRTTGIALRLDGDATYQPDEFTTKNLKITGTGTWDIPIFHYGADRLSPLGLRVVTHENLFIGRDISAGLYGETVVQLQIYGGGIYGGTSNQLQLAGNVGTSKGCTDVMIQGFKINGQLNVDDCTGGIFNIICGSIVLGADADDNCIMGYNSGATTNSGSGNNTAALV